MGVNIVSRFLKNIITTFPPCEFRKKQTKNKHVERTTDGGHQRNIIQLLVFEETNIKIYWCVKGDIDRREMEANITFHTPINFDIGLFKHQLLFYYFSVSSVWLMLSKKRRSVILNLELSNCHVFLSEVANQFIYLFI